MKPKLVLESVAERDIDLLIINKLMTDSDFVKAFCCTITNPKPIDTTHVVVKELHHSKMDSDGESDVFVLLNCNATRIGLFIEDKIDAIAMPDQHGRYIVRAEKGLNDKYDEYRIVLIAPDDYDNEEARKYENRISYEYLKDIANDPYSVALLEEAVREQKKDYEVVEDNRVTVFRQKYYQFVKNNYKQLSVREVPGPAGTNAVWVTFDSLRKGTYIQHKSNKGYVDLEIAGYGNKTAELYQRNKELLIKEGLKVAKANKSAAIRAEVPPMDFHNQFEEYHDDMHEVCKAVDQLMSIITKINYDV